MQSKYFLNALRSCSFILAIDAVHYDQPLILCELKVLDETAKHTIAGITDSKKLKTAVS